MREAVTAIFVYADEIFIIKRQDYLSAFPGYLAFPGGKIDKEDREFTYAHPLLSAFPGGQMRALIREVEEELGFDLEGVIERGEVDDIIHFGLAQTPAFQKIRFSTHYFKVVLNKRPQMKPDAQEIESAEWVCSKSLWQRYSGGEGMMVTPMANTVRALAENIDAEGASPFNLTYDSESELPFAEAIYSLGQIPVPSNTLPPARNTNALLVGGGEYPRYLIDPSPESPEILEYLIKTLVERPIDGIVISHHHPDHNEHAPQLAKRLSVPIFCTKTTARRLEAREGEGFFRDIEVTEITEGYELTKWLGRSVCCYELPGHDDGMIGLAPEDMAWFFVSDLVQQGASVVIPEPEGDMQAYFDSLERVIDLRPKITIPSHGMPVGGSHLLRKTLQHRRERERMVAYLNARGKGPEEITRSIYPGLEERLIPLAQQNVRQHLKKLGIDPPGQISAAVEDEKD